MCESLRAFALLVVLMVLFLCASYAGVAAMISTLTLGVTIIVTIIGG